jgi:hypothetical protein
MDRDLRRARLRGTRCLVPAIIAVLLLMCVCFSASLGCAPIPPGAEEDVEWAKEDLADRMGVDKEQIRVAAVDAVNWPDSCLGYGEPGELCLQVITPGYRIVLYYAGRFYEYRSAAQLVLRPDP